MRYAVAVFTLAIFMLCWAIIGSAIPDSPQSQQTKSDYRAAYERWCRAIDSNPALGEPFWVSTAHGPAELRSAVADLLSIGPNLVPFLAEEMRNEKEHLRLYQLVRLLNRVSGIKLYSSGEDVDYVKAMPQYRDQFIEEWDSGKYLSATELLHSTWTHSDESRSRKAIDPKNLIPIRRYGVYALPFIIESLEKQNSPEIFAAFLIITGEAELYSYYLEKSSEFMPERGQKLSYVKSWVGRNERGMDKLAGLHQRITALTSK